MPHMPARFVACGAEGRAYIRRSGINPERTSDQSVRPEFIARARYRRTLPLQRTGGEAAFQAALEQHIHH